MITIMKQAFVRLKREKGSAVVYLVLSIASIFVALYVSSLNTSLGSIAVQSEQHKWKSSDVLHVTYVKEAVAKSRLVAQEYDAFVQVHKDGSLSVTSVKSDAFKQDLINALQGQIGSSQHKKQRGVGTCVIGFVMMFAIMQSLVYMMQYGEDKELRRMERILLSPITFSTYLGGMILFTMLSVILPALLTLAVCCIVGIDIGFSLAVYAGLLFVLSLFATAFALFLNTLFAQKDTANMLGSALAVLASIISGGFYEVANEGGILDTIASMLPTKAILQLSESLEAGLTSQAVEHLVFVLLWAVILFGAALFVQHVHKRAGN